MKPKEVVPKELKRITTLIIICGNCCYEFHIKLGQLGICRECGCENNLGVINE